MINTQSGHYAGFVSISNAPRGILVSKPFHGVFTDPDGDELTYAVTVPDDLAQMVEEVVIPTKAQIERSSHPIETILRVFFRADADDDWKAITPALADPLVITATLTATDPEGLSASVSGDFLVGWESQPVLLSATASRQQEIKLSFDQAVEDAPAPSPSQFTVNVVSEDGSTGNVEVDSVSVNGDIITLELGSALEYSQTVTVDYAHDDAAPLQRVGGGDPASGFSEQAHWRLRQRSAEPPSVTAIAVSSNAGDDNTYGLGDVIRVTLTFSEAVDVTGVPRLKIKMAPNYGEKWALYGSGDATTDLVFAYTVVEPNTSSQGIAVLENTLELSDGTIRSSATQADALLTHPDLDHDDSHKVDWQLSNPPLQVSILATNPSNPQSNQTAYFLAHISNSPPGQEPAYDWQRLEDNDWVTHGRSRVFSWWSDKNAGTQTFRLIVTYESGETATSEPLDVTWSEPRFRVTVEANDSDAYASETVTLTPRVNFTPPGAIISYQWEQRPQGQEQWTPAGSDFTKTFSPAAAGSWDFRVTASSDSGESATSGPANIRVHDMVSVCDRTPQVRDALVRKQGMSCEDIRPDDLRGIRGWLEIIGGNVRIGWNYQRNEPYYLWTDPIEALKPGDFGGLSGIRVLNLKKHSFTTLPDNVFEDMSGVTHMDLSSNDLTHLSPNTFTGLSGISNLDLSSNSLTDLSPDSLSGLSSLTSLELSDNGLTALGPNTFSKVTRLGNLSIHDNRLATLHADAFDGLSNVQSLNLTRNELTALPADVFEDLTGLRYLYLRTNLLNALPAGVFANASGLEVITLSDNRLTTLPAGVFDGLDKMYQLQMEENRLTGLASDVFADTTGLRKLVLSHQNGSLTELPAGVFDGLSRVTTLDITDTGLTGLPDHVFKDMSALDDLHLSDNNLTALNANAFDGLSGLNHMFIRNNRLATMHPDAFDGLTELETLDLRHNELGTVSGGTFEDLAKLKYLYLHYNRIAELSADAFDGLEKVEWFLIGNNRITELPEGVFNDLTGVQWLALNHNNLTSLREDTFEGLSQLEALDLYKNELAQMPDNLLRDLPSLLKVALSGNPGYPFTNLNIHPDVEIR